MKTHVHKYPKWNFEVGEMNIGTSDVYFKYEVFTKTCVKCGFTIVKVKNYKA